MAEIGGGYPVANGGLDESDQFGGRSRPHPGGGGGSRGYLNTTPGSARHSTAPSSVRSSGRLVRSPSPQSRIDVNHFDHDSIMTMSQQCTEDLSIKMREKNALADLLSELKKKKMQYESKGSKKMREVDLTQVRTMEMEKKLAQINNANKMMISELNGLRKENEKLEYEVEDMRKCFKESSTNYEQECQDVEKVKRTLYSYRKEINTEAKLRDGVQQDLRASRTAQTLVISRLEDVAKRNHALKTCVANTFNA